MSILAKPLRVIVKFGSGSKKAQSPKRNRCINTERQISTVMFLNLPIEIMLQVCDYLDQKSLFRLIQSSKLTGQASKRILLFRRINSLPILRRLYVVARNTMKHVDRVELGKVVRKMHCYIETAIGFAPLKYSTSNNTTRHAHPIQCREIGEIVGSKPISDSYWKYKVKESQIRFEISRLYWLVYSENLVKNDFPFKSFELQLISEYRVNNAKTLLKRKLSSSNQNMQASLVINLNTRISCKRIRAEKYDSNPTNFHDLEPNLTFKLKRFVLSDPQIGEKKWFPEISLALNFSKCK